ncbi:MAG: site-specific integrase [Marinifilaceae bacterium]|nr:site-specific integrase [Marinifilaceae bacterium]
MNRMTINLVLKASKKNSAGENPIYARVVIDGNRLELSAKKWIDPLKWDKYRQEVKGRSEAARTANQYLTDFTNGIQTAFNMLKETNETVTIKLLKDELQGNSKSEKWLVKVFEENNALSAMEKSKYSDSTLRQYSTTLQRLKEFIAKEYGSSDIKIKVLDQLFIRKFDLFLRLDYAIEDNTVAKYLKQLKKVIHYAMSMKYILHDPFYGYKIKTVKNTRQYLTQEELARIENHHFKIERLERVRDLFIFVCYTGLAYSDLKDLTADQITMGIDGKNWLTYKRNKTGVEAKFPLLTPAQRILDKYANDPECVSNGLLLPVRSNQKLNSYLSEIEDVCGIKKHITMHIGRHTFASSVTLANNIPIETVSKMLGHSDIKTTQIYAKVVDTKVSEDMKKLDEKIRKTG